MAAHWQYLEVSWLQWSNVLASKLSASHQDSKRKPLDSSVSSAAKYMLYHVQGRKDATSFSNDTLPHEYLESGKSFATLGREWGALLTEGVAWISSNQVFSENHRALTFAPDTLCKSQQILKPCCFYLQITIATVSNKYVPKILSVSFLWYPIWIQLPFLSLKPSFKLGLYHLIHRFLIYLLVSQILKPP